MTVHQMFLKGQEVYKAAQKEENYKQLKQHGKDINLLKMMGFGRFRKIEYLEIDVKMLMGD
jgi:hypothetical protein